jgi:carbon monoxide dehydrogenase subunit G
VKVQGDRTFAAPRATVWSVLQDPAQMAEIMPGVESFDVEDDRRWKANVKIPLGLGSLRMSINFEKTEEREPEFSQLRAKGTGVGALMNLVTQFHLTEVDSGTAMAWEAEVRILGPVASMGQRVLQPIVNQQVEHVLKALDTQVARAGGEPIEREGEKTPPQESDSGGQAGGTEPSLDAETPTDPETKDYGPPAETTAEADPAEEAGSSGAEEGLSPWEEEPYSEERPN